MGINDIDENPSIIVRLKNKGIELSDSDIHDLKTQAQQAKKGDRVDAFKEKPFFEQWAIIFQAWCEKALGISVDLGKLLGKGAISATGFFTLTFGLIQAGIVSSPGLHIGKPEDYQHTANNQVTISEVINRQSNHELLKAHEGQVRVNEEIIKQLRALSKTMESLEESQKLFIASIQDMRNAIKENERDIKVLFRN